MVSCSVLTVNIGVVLAKTEESFGNLRLKIYLCHIIHLFSYQYAMKKYLLLIFVILIHSFAVLADNVIKSENGENWSVKQMAVKIHISSGK